MFLSLVVNKGNYMTVLAGKTVFVCVDSSEDTHFYIRDDDTIERYYEANPDADGFAVANAIGRDLTAEEQALLPNLAGAICY